MNADGSIDVGTLLDDPLVVVRTAARPIGYVGLDIPEDLLAAPPYTAVHLPWQRGRPTPFADRWLEDTFPGWARSILESWAAGHFDFMEFVIFSRGDDASQRLYYYVCELQRRGIFAGPKPLIYNVARIRRPSSELWTVNAVRQLAASLDLDDGALEAGIADANRRRTALADCDGNRSSPGYRYEQLARASLFAPADRIAFDRPGMQLTEGVRVLLAGSSPPDDSLHRAVDDAGCTVVGEFYDRNLTRLGGRVAEGKGDPANRVGHGAYRNRTGTRSFVDRAALLAAEVQTRRADAVIHWLHEEDEGVAWDVVESNRMLASHNVPVLTLTRRNWDLSDAPERAIADFLGSLCP